MVAPNKTAEQIFKEAFKQRDMIKEHISEFGCAEYTDDICNILILSNIHAIRNHSDEAQIYENYMDRHTTLDDWIRIKNCITSICKNFSDVAIICFVKTLYS